MIHLSCKRAEEKFVWFMMTSTDEATANFEEINVDNITANRSGENLNAANEDESDSDDQIEMVQLNTNIGNKLLVEKFSNWSTKHAINNTAVNEILEIMREFKEQVFQRDEIYQKIFSELRAIREQMLRREENNRKLLNKLTEEIVAMRNEVNQLKLNGSIFTTSEHEEVINKLLPFSQMSDLINFEEELKVNEDILGELKRIILRIGGDDYPIFIRSAVKRVITDQLAMQFSWRGTKEKPTMQKLCFISLIRELCHQKFDDVEDIKINTILQQHFVHAKDRSEKRQKSAAAASATM